MNGPVPVGILQDAAHPVGILVVQRGLLVSRCSRLRCGRFLEVVGDGNLVVGFNLGLGLLLALPNLDLLLVQVALHVGQGIVHGLAGRVELPPLPSDGLGEVDEGDLAVRLGVGPGQLGLVGRPLGLSPGAEDDLLQRSDGLDGGRAGRGRESPLVLDGRRRWRGTSLLTGLELVVDAGVDCLGQGYHRHAPSFGRDGGYGRFVAAG